MASAIEHYRAAEALLQTYDELSERIDSLEATRFVGDEDPFYAELEDLYDRRSGMINRAQVHATLATTKYSHMDFVR